MTFRAHVSIRVQFCALFPRIDMASSTARELASLVAQVRGVKFYDLQMCGACYGDQVHLVRQPLDRYDANCIDVIMMHGRLSLLGHLEAPVAAIISPVMRDVSVEVSG